MTKDKFFIDFHIKNIVTKGVLEDSERILALERNNFKKCENNNIMGDEDYYIISAVLV